MSYASERRLLQALIGLLGAVAVAAGIFAVITGPDGQTGGEAVAASVDSEYRFYAALWLAYGVVALSVVPRVERAKLAVRGLAAALFVAGLARVLAWVDAGRPDEVFLVLLALELGLPPLLVLLQRSLHHRSAATV